MAHRLQVTQSVQLLISPLVDVPTVLGCFRPVVLVPLSALTELPRPHLRALLAHELAHVKRLDYLVNVFQRVVESVLFYHPAVWWVSRQIRIEREMACDDLAIAASGDSLTYVRALAELEVRRRVPAESLGADGGVLLDRIRRIVGQGAALNHDVPARGPLLAMGAFWLIGIAALGIQGAQSEAAVLAGGASLRTAVPGGGGLSVLMYGPLGQDRRDSSLVRGRVVDGSNRPMAGVRVALDGTGQAVQSTANGRFEITHVRRGRWRVTASKPGFVLASGRDDSGPRVAVDGEVIENLLLTMVPSSAIEGRVVDPKGNPVAGAAVEALPKDSASVESFLSDTTDDHGRFRIWGVTSGVYVVRASVSRVRVGEQSRSPFMPTIEAVTYHPSAAAVKDAREITVRAGSDVTGVVVGMKMAFVSLSGTVRTSDGRAARSARFSLHPDGQATRQSVAGSVGRDGAFAVSGLPPGRYVFSAWTVATHEQAGTPTAPAAEAAHEVLSIVEGKGVIELTLRKTFSVRGRVVSEEGTALPIEPSQVFVSWKSENGQPKLPVPQQPLRNWNFEIRGVLGAGRLVASMARAASGWKVKSIRRSVADITNAVLDVDGRDVDGIDVVLAPASRGRQSGARTP
jgi:hypothetical protein